MRSLPASLVALALLTACGQKGPLVLPDPAHRKPVPAAAPAAGTTTPERSTAA